MLSKEANVDVTEMHPEPPTTVLMIMASHQTFSGQLKHLTGQTKFDQSNILYIINGKVIKFLIEKPMSRQFSILIISTATKRWK